MNLETPVEYFYGETLRWSFGFENPNKAAVIFACVVPLLWGLWLMAWRLENKWLKITALLTTAVMLIGSWHCLSMTFSRGGLVAAVGALIYLIVISITNENKLEIIWHWRARVGFSAFLVAVLVCDTVCCGLAGRSAEVLGKDASVENRYELWGGALQMAAENVHGFGTGKSGGQYMQWYQPLDRHEGYRTMVNSYLTFLVEQGWLISVFILSIFAIFWVWTAPRNRENMMIALRSSIIAFLLAGIFSTTMEDWRLWIIPVFCGLVLGIVAVCKRYEIGKKRLFVTGGTLMAVCVLLFLLGFQKSVKDPLRREFGTGAHSGDLNAIGPKHPRQRSIGCMVDEAILGDQYAKLLREMALGSDAKIYLGDQIKDAERILCMGKKVRFFTDGSGKPLFLLAPVKIQDDEVNHLFSGRESVRVLLPEIDEDGRAEFWDQAINSVPGETFKKTILCGVGNRVDWAWSEVIEIMKAQ